MKGYKMGIKKNYIKMVEEFDILPTDHMVGILTGNSDGNCSMIRKELESKGYKFKHIPRKSIKVNGRTVGEWHVMERPQEKTAEPENPAPDQTIDMQEFKKEVVADIMAELERRYRYGQHNQNQ